MLSFAARKRIPKEIQRLQRSPPPGIALVVTSESLTELEATICGPPDSVYEKGEFRVRIDVSKNYPFQPPVVVFVTRVFHPNICSSSGRICLDILKDRWKASLNLSSVLVSIQQLLGDPNPDDPLDAAAAKLYKDDHARFAQQARDWVQKHAVAGKKGLDR